MRTYVQRTSWVGRPVCVCAALAAPACGNKIYSVPRLLFRHRSLGTLRTGETEACGLKEVRGGRAGAQPPQQRGEAAGARSSTNGSTSGSTISASRRSSSITSGSDGRRSRWLHHDGIGNDGSSRAVRPSAVVAVFPSFLPHTLLPTEHMVHTHTLIFFFF